jgi:hypothetical protein
VLRARWNRALDAIRARMTIAHFDDFGACITMHFGCYLARLYMKVVTKNLLDEPRQCGAMISALAQRTWRPREQRESP